MTTTVAAIAAEAFTGVAAEVSGVIKTCTLTRTTPGEYDPATGTDGAGTTATDTGRAVFDFSTDQRKLSDMFPAFTIGPADKLAYVEGLTTMAPKEADALDIGGDDYAVLAVIDVVEAGGLYAVLVR
jgi:hypothetical protein